MITTEATVSTSSTLSTLTPSNTHTSSICQAQHPNAGDGHLVDGEDSHHERRHQHNVHDDLKARPTQKSAKRADFKLVKKRGIIPDGLVKRCRLARQKGGGGQPRES